MNSPHTATRTERAEADIGIVGLGVMGAALARNFHSRGLRVGTYNREPEMTAAFGARYGDDRFDLHDDIAGFVACLSRPRRILAMVTAGRAVDAVLEALAPHLSADDIVIDGGNSHFPDTERRARWAAERGFRFFGMGVSGGEEGALNGPAMMPGGDAEAWERLRPVLEQAAAHSDSGPCVDYCGSGGAGHFVKMVHNGIEYGDMQLISEVWTLLHELLSLEDAAIGDVFGRWNQGALASYLVEITAEILQTPDPATGGALVRQILDVAGQKGTGRLTSMAAIELGIPVPTITAAVDARAMSACKAERVAGEARFPGSSAGADRRAQAAALGASSEEAIASLGAALLTAKLMSYTQGFALLRAGSLAHGFGSDLARIARIWKGGCIIRAAFLDRVHDAFVRDPSLPLLLLDPALGATIAEGVAALRRTVAAAAAAGVAIPALAASLAYFETMTRAIGSAQLVQAQRDCFGAHTYRRLSAPDVAVHSVWSRSEPQ